ncbi:MAG: spherulation-specific family 4 protein [Actinomycetota bacterium]
MSYLDVITQQEPRAPARLGVPAYFYPWPGDRWWAGLAEVPPGTIIVLDPDDGPGRAADPNYLAALAGLAHADAEVFGYVDSAYGGRPGHLLIDDALRYRAWYGVQGIFIDQVAGTTTDLEHATEISAGLRAEGFRIAMNPGQPVIAQEYFTLADHVVVFEGCLADYLESVFPGWIADQPREAVWHLVHAVGTAAAYATVVQLAAQRGAGVLFATDGGLPNAWDRLPPYWPSMLADARSLGLRGRPRAVSS